MQWSVDRLVRLAKRESNSIRPYLFVNPLQGKHIPTSPDDAIGMCQQMAALINSAYPEDRLYVIGFAETATGIAASVSSFLNNIVYYQNTTRERDGSDHLFFSEAHSHATDQLLRTTGMKTALQSVDRLVFIDDEVTTGNTICNLIRIIQTGFHAHHLKYTILSALNSMSESRFSELQAQGIDCLFLCRIPYEYEKDSIMGIHFDAQKHILAPESGAQHHHLTVSCPVNPRNTVDFQDYVKANRTFAEEVRMNLPNDNIQLDSALVLGTEEFMYPTFVVGEMIRQQGYAKSVRIHSTTRSPVIASDQKGYPLFSRYQIRSPYDSQRITFIYNLQKYEKVFILTDAAIASEGIRDLCGALESVGNSDITIVRWRCNGDKETV